MIYQVQIILENQMVQYGILKSNGTTPATKKIAGFTKGLWTITTPYEDGTGGEPLKIPINIIVAKVGPIGSF